MKYQKRKWCEIKGPCPICGHSGWCTSSEDGAVILCRRAESPYPVKQKDSSLAWIHARGSSEKPVNAAPHRPTGKRLGKSELNAMLKEFRGAINSIKLQRFSDRLGVSVKSLHAYGVGYDPSRGAWTFPMRDGQRDPIGIHCRDQDGRKRSIPGSRLGLHIPENYNPQPIPAELTDDPLPWLTIFPEGVSDACAAFDLGVVAIGRPSNAAGGKEIAVLLKSTPQQEVIVFADNDEPKYLPSGIPFWPGIEGALSVAETAMPITPKMRFLLAPKEMKDLRGWLNGGCDRATLLAHMLAAPLVNRRWLTAAHKRLEVRKATERKQAAALTNQRVLRSAAALSLEQQRATA